MKHAMICMAILLAFADSAKCQELANITYHYTAKGITSDVLVYPEGVDCFPYLFKEVDVDVFGSYIQRLIISFDPNAQPETVAGFADWTFDGERLVDDFYVSPGPPGWRDDTSPASLSSIGYVRVRDVGPIARGDAGRIELNNGCLLQVNGVESERREFPFGDSTKDGVFNSSDLVQVFAAGKYEQLDEFARWEEGDWNWDGRFSTRDIVDGFQRGTYSASPNPVPVPEPSSLVLLVFWAVLLTAKAIRNRSRPGAIACADFTRISALGSNEGAVVPVNFASIAWIRCW